MTTTIRPVRSRPESAAIAPRVAERAVGVLQVGRRAMMGCGALVVPPTSRVYRVCFLLFAVSTSAVASGSWGGQRPSLAGYITGTGATRGVTAAGGR
jgi:hypothetical protein